MFAVFSCHIKAAALLSKTHRHGDEHEKQEKEETVILARSFWFIFPDKQRNSTMYHHSFSLSTHFWKTGRKLINTIFRFALGEYSPTLCILCFALQIRSPSSPGSAAQEADLKWTPPNQLPCPSMGDTYKTREGKRFQAIIPSTISLAGHMMAVGVLYEDHALWASSPKAAAAALPGFWQLPSPPSPLGGNRFSLLLPRATFPTLLI